jgi:hypothetical protein
MATSISSLYRPTIDESNPYPYRMESVCSYSMDVIHIFINCYWVSMLYSGGRHVYMYVYMCTAWLGLRVQSDCVVGSDFVAAGGNNDNYYTPPHPSRILPNIYIYRLTFWHQLLGVDSPSLYRTNFCFSPPYIYIRL